MKAEKDQSPDFALRLLVWFCPAHLYEEIEGDLLQKFNCDIKKFGEHRAKRRLIWNTIRFFRTGIILRNKFSFELFPIDMLQNYFKISFRSIQKNKIFASINILGLAIGMAAFLLIMHYIRFERSYENFHRNANNIFRVTLAIFKGSEYVKTDCEMYPPVGSLLTQELSEVLDFVRMYDFGNPEVKAGDKAFYEERIYFADPSVFKLFSYEILNGNPVEALNAPFVAAITESMAKKYFGRIDVVGESIEIGKSLYKITALLADTPANTHLKFNFLLSHTTLSKLWGYNENEFSGNNEYTYLLMTDKVDLTSFNKKLKTISLNLKEKIGDDRLVAEPIKDIHLYSDKGYEPEPNGNARSVYFLLIIATFVILIAWINYINLSTARAVARAREVGIRRVLGSLKSQLIFQFLAESIIVSLLAGFFSLVLIYVFLPFFISLSGTALSVHILQDKVFWHLLLSMVIFGSVFAGIYPAFVLSSFKPVSILKGKFHTSAPGPWLRKGLAIFQFAATAVLIACMCTVYSQIRYLQTYSLGMNIEQVIIVRAPDIMPDSLQSAGYQRLKDELLSHSSVQLVAHSQAVPGGSLHSLSTTGNVFRLGDEKNEKGFIYYVNSFDENFIPTFNIALAGGSNFENGMAANNHVIINEEAMHILGFKNVEETIGSTLSFYDHHKTVIGVLKNFYQRSPKEKHLPMVFWYDNSANYFSIRIKAGETHETIATVKAAWKNVFPNKPFDYFFLDERYNEQYKSEYQFGQVIAVFSTVACFIACMGLFGLSYFTIVQRTKEIGIRKVLGASVAEIIRLLCSDIVSLVLIAGMIALPVASLAMEEWLSHYAVRISVNAWFFALPLIIILFIALLTVSFGTIRAAQTNPVDTLKNE